MSSKFLKQAREKLKTNDPTIGLPGREDKINELENFLTERLKVRQTTEAKRARVSAGVVANIAGRHDCKTIFLCGVPGTGKTAVALSVIERLYKKSKTKNAKIHPFEYIYVNAQHLSAPEKVYSEILYKLTQEKLTSDRAQQRLDNIFKPRREIDIEDGKKKKSVNRKTKLDNGLYKIVIIDELDLLYSEKRQTVFYSLFDWPTSSESKIILVTIANAMDLPERFARGRIGSRLGWNKLIFEPYTSQHLDSILRARLGDELLNKCFEKTAILIATKRIGKTTGDARRIIDTCCLAVDEAIKDGQSKVTSEIVDKVGFQNVEKAKVNYIDHCPPLQLLVLQGILNESASQGEDNINARGVYNQVNHALTHSKHPWLNDFQLGLEEYFNLLNTLQVVGLISLESNRSLLTRRLAIKDSSEVFRDVIRKKKVTIDEY